MLWFKIELKRFRAGVARKVFDDFNISLVILSNPIALLFFRLAMHSKISDFVKGVLRLVSHLSTLS